MKKIILFLLCMFPAIVHSSIVLKKSMDYVSNKEPQQAAVISQRASRMLTQIGMEYINALKEGTPLPDLDHKGLSVWEVKNLKRDIYEYIKAYPKLKTPKLSDWLDKGLENYTVLWAKQQPDIGDKHYAAMSDHIAKKDGGYLFGDKINKEDKKYMDYNTLKQLVPDQKYAFLTQDFIALNHDNQQEVIKIVKDSQRSKQPITHISIHVTDLRQLGQPITNLFKEYPNLTLIINLDTNQQTSFIIHGNIKTVKYLIIAGHNITTIRGSLIVNSKELISVDLSFLTMLTTIGSYAFDSKNLTFIRLPQRLITIGEGFLSTAHNIEYLQLSQSITSVDGFFLFNCSKLKFLQLSSKLTSVGNRFLEGCKNLTHVLAGQETLDLIINIETCYGASKNYEETRYQGTIKDYLLNKEFFPKLKKENINLLSDHYIQKELVQGLQLASVLH